MPELKIFSHIAIIQTAFIGDVALVLHLAQAIKFFSPESRISFITTPVAAPLAQTCNAIDEVFAFDKRKDHSGWSGIKNFSSGIKNVDCVIAPHRSLRTTLLTKFLKPKFSVGFNKNSLSFLYSKRVKYPLHLHEIERNFSLLKVFEDVKKEIPFLKIPAPQIIISQEDENFAGQLLSQEKISSEQKIVLLAPGSVWPTKRWRKEYFAELANKLSKENFLPVLMGSKTDEELCAEIEKNSSAKNLCSKTTLPQTLALLKRTSLLISNDSAPTHLAGLVNCPAITIFGPTTPIFGFAPRGEFDKVLQNENLSCRPCSIHGTKECPLGTHECMKSVLPEEVLQSGLEILQQKEFYRA